MLILISKIFFAILDTIKLRLPSLPSVSAVLGKGTRKLI